MQDRGAFMSINSSLQQIAGGVASVIAGMIIVQQPGGKLFHFNTLGYVVIGVMIICVFCMQVISRQVLHKMHIRQEKKVELVA
jgi:predicted MFS family arabinose efflux permease